MAISERAKAKAEGRKVYFTGRPCKHGHIAERKTASGACGICHRMAQEKWDRKRRHPTVAPPPAPVPEAPADYREDETKAISLAAYQGVASEALASKWLNEQAARLQVSADDIIAAIRLRWTLIEIEQLRRGDAYQLRDKVDKHKAGQGAIPSAGIFFSGAVE